MVLEWELFEQQVAQVNTPSLTPSLSLSFSLSFFPLPPSLQGLRELQVDNVEEAMLLLRLGLQHRHVAATRLNYQSSRSHSIYTIKLIKVVDMEHPQHAIVNR